MSCTCTTTPGFKKDIPVTRAFVDYIQAAGGKAEPVFVTTLPVTDTVVDSRAGSLHYTGGSLDVALDGNGYFELQSEQGPVYTRQGNLQIDARWDAIRKAREAAKKKNGRNAPSPSVMIAWAVVRAMEKHAPFRRLILEDETIVENENFDLGIARSIALAADAARRRLQLRAGFFNALNHTNFGLPQASIDSPAFGAITRAAPARQIQLGARFEF